MITIDRLQRLCDTLACGEPGDHLSVRESDEEGCRYEVYANGYPLNMHCRTAHEAEQCIRQHYRDLAEQLASGTATPTNRIGG
jgi:hypothetical protein